MLFKALIAFPIGQQNTEIKVKQNHIACLIMKKEVENKHQQFDDFHMVQNMTDMEKNVNPGLKDG